MSAPDADSSLEAKRSDRVPTAQTLIEQILNNELNILLVRGLRNKASVTVAISELQRIAGDDWLLELSEQAQLLRALASPHPINKLLTIVTRNK